MLTKGEALSLLDELGLDLDKIRDKNYLTHNLHPYSAKFIPQIPAALIDKYSRPGELVVDPFCGSGTALVESSLLGRPSVGTDVNPLACLIAKAKCSTLDPRAQAAISNHLFEMHEHMVRWKRGVRDKHGSHAQLQFPNSKHWFKPYILDELSFLKAKIAHLNSPVARLYATTAFSAIIVKVSRQESETRWVAVDKPFYRGLAIESYISKLADIQKRAIEFRSRKPSSSYIFRSDSRSLPLRDRSAKLIVTSPPYLNSYDYYLYHKLRLFLLGYDHRLVERLEVGSRHRHCDWGEGLDSYTFSMRECLQEFFRVLAPGGFAAIVVGDSILRGQLINMGDCFLSLVHAVGFKLLGHYTFDQRKYTSSFTRGFQNTSKFSHILVCQKT